MSNRAPNQHFAICCKMNIASIINKRLMEMERSTYKFMFSLETVTFYWKTFYNLLYNLVCGLSCFLSSSEINDKKIIISNHFHVR